jgi:2-polyprenyl-3-methyl-5-hydroxy-6-metoxy-1,4-benzoquinol methylase
MHNSHIEAKTLFDATADTYQSKADVTIHNIASLIFQRRIDIVKNFLGQIHATGTVLDFGMGPAVFGKFCVDSGFQYLGIDIAPKMVELAKSLNLSNANFRVGDLDSLGEFNGQNQVVMAIGLIDYLEHPNDGIKLLANCVQPGGYLMLSFRNRHSLPRVLRDVFKNLWHLLPRPKSNQSQTAFSANVHEHSFDFDSELRPWLTKLGFDEFKVDYFNCSPFFFSVPLPAALWRVWLKLDSILAGKLTRWMCSGGVLIARYNNGTDR